MTECPAPQIRRLRLLIADDQPLIRRALAMTLGVEPDIEVVGQAVDGQDAIDQALALQPDVVVMDLQMPRVSGVVATREITARLPAVGIVVLTTFDHDDLVFEAIRAGARAYLLKDAAEDEVLETIRAVQRGESRLSPPVARKVMEEFRRLASALPAAGPSSPTPATARPADPLEEPLTDKEERILQLIAEGLSNKKIGATVFLAEGTVKNYVSRIMEKLHARSRTELAVRAVARKV
ncbi:response regulator transcription factor [Pseudorhodoferax sp. Leaf274]|uniref:response regulator n=1 Tax=Pseudorhodoferax sp. Leaf274 TaxID=1736318 RepID=UPI000702B9B8|nr:response regulator transcription factor [Pseudorhodoferax sp. Leaf274]KQP39895.1 LuxR family transcriptional regulator [Pseudorhodoferax sp. Leaf274]